MAAQGGLLKQAASQGILDILSLMRLGSTCR